MKIIVLHDQHGNIISTVIPEPQFREGLRLEPQSGEGVIEVDASEIGIHDSFTGGEKDVHLGNAVKTALDKLKVDVKQRKLVPKGK